MVNANREAAVGRIRALLSKTVANGCTESEALAAAAKAGELMDRYALELSDVEIQAERCEERDATGKRHDVDRVAASIARFCGCKSWITNGRITYFGMTHDVEVAQFLTDLCRSAMETAFREYLRSPQRPQWRGKGMDGRYLRKSFMVGMAGRLSERINTMAETREASASTATGTALVLIKDAVVREQFEASGIKLYPRRAARYYNFEAADDAGRAAADCVNIATGIRDGSDNPANKYHRTIPVNYPDDAEALPF